MARGPRFWALGVDFGPRGGAFEGIVDPKNNNKHICLLAPKRRLRYGDNFGREVVESLGIRCPTAIELRRLQGIHLGF